MKAILKAIFKWFLMITNLACYGFVVSTMWGWFMVTTFGLPILPFWNAIGVTLTICLIRPCFPTISVEYIENSVAREKISTYTQLLSLVYPWCALFLGYIVKSFI